jgi:hypothetical protein
VRGFLPTALDLELTGSAAKSFGWAIEAQPDSPCDPTRAEMDAAARGSLVAQPADFQRRTRWPRLMRLSEARPIATSDGGELLRYSYREASNYVGQEQLLMSRRGRLVFQRDSWWATDSIGVDLGALAFDLAIMTGFTSRYFVRLGLTGTFSVSLRLHAVPPASAHFSNGIEPEQRHRSGVLEREIVEGRETAPVGVHASQSEHLVLAKRLMDRIANEFRLQPSPWEPTGAHFMVIDEASVARLLGTFE